MNEMINEKGSGAELNIQELLEAYLRRWKLIVVCMVVAAMATLAVSVFCITPMYRAGIKVYVNNRTVTEDKDTTSSGDLSASIYLVKGYELVTKSDSVLQVVADKLENDYTIAQLKSAITTEEEEDTVMFYLYVTLPDAVEAARVANVMAEAIPVEIPRIIHGTSAKVVDNAKIPSSKYSPNYTRNTILGAIAGILVAAAYVTVVYLRDTRIKDENDLTDMFDIPILGRIPQFENEPSSRYGYKADKK